jgi:hypothetical protein
MRQSRSARGGSKLLARPPIQRRSPIPPLHALEFVRDVARLRQKIGPPLPMTFVFEGWF